MQAQHLPEHRQVEALVLEACELVTRHDDAVFADPDALVAIGGLRVDLLAATSDVYDVAVLDDAYGAVLELDELAARLQGLPVRRHRMLVGA